MLAASATACMVLAFAGMVLSRLRHRQPERYIQLTDFTDSAVAPTLSPDGHMVAFIRGGDGFLTSDQIYIKMLPNGEARQVTNDPTVEIRSGILPGWGGDRVHGAGDFRVFHLRGVSSGRRASSFAEERRGTGLAGPATAALFP